MIRSILMFIIYATASIFLILVFISGSRSQNVPPEPGVEDRLQLDLNICNSTVQGLKNTTLFYQTENKRLVAENAKLKADLAKKEEAKP